MKGQLASKRDAIQTKQVALEKQSATREMLKATLGSKDLGKLSPKEQQTKLALQDQLKTLKVGTVTLLSSCLF